MTWLLLTLACAVGFLRGTKEGMIFVQDWNARFVESVHATAGPKCHAWFGQYHTIGAAKDVILLLLGVIACWWLIKSNKTLFKKILIFSACAFAIWECYELAYWFSREGIFIYTQERIVFSELFGNGVVRGIGVYALHGFRIGMICVLTIGGSK